MSSQVVLGGQKEADGLHWMELHQIGSLKLHEKAYRFIRRKHAVLQSTQTSCRICLLCLFLSVQHNHTSSMEHLLFYNFQGPHHCFWRVTLKCIPTIPGKVWYLTSLDKSTKNIAPENFKGITRQPECPGTTKVIPHAN